MRALYFDNNLVKMVMMQAASVFYRNAALSAISPTRYAEVPEPRIPNRRWLKVKNRACGLCGSDIHFIYMEMDPKSFPAATPGISRKFLGHELIGEVVETGDEVPGFSKGDRVCLRIDWPSCYQLEIDPMCPECANGDYMMCRNLGAGKLPIVNTGGGFSPYMVMHRTQPFLVPEGLSDDDALLIEPVACAVHGVMKRRPEKGERVLVLGCGTIGLLCVAVAKAVEPGCEVTALARYPFQAEMARKMGADNVIMGGKNPYRAIADLTGAKYFEGYFGNRILLGGFDVVYDTIGNDGSLNDAMRWVKGRGSIVVIGINFKPGKIDYTPVWHQEITVTGINCHAMEKDGLSSFDVAAKLLLEKRIPTEGFITHRFPMREYKKAIEAFFSKGNEQAIKIVLEHER